MPVEESHVSTVYPNAMHYRFQESVTMSSYLVAVVAGNLTSMEKTADGVSATLFLCCFVIHPILHTSVLLLLLLLLLLLVLLLLCEQKQVRVWARPGFEHLLTFALDTAAVVMPYYETYFGQPFPLPKQDLVAIPDFAAGGAVEAGSCQPSGTCSAFCCIVLCSLLYCFAHPY